MYYLCETDKKIVFILLNNYENHQITPEIEAKVDAELKAPLIEQFEKEGHPYFASARSVREIVV